MAAKNFLCFGQEGVQIYFENYENSKGIIRVIDNGSRNELLLIDIANITNFNYFIAFIKIGKKLG